MKALAVFLVCVLSPALVWSEYHCPGEADCTCFRGVKGDWELLCPRSIQRQPSLIGSLSPEREIQLQCTMTNNWEDLKLMSGLQLGKVKTFSLRLCPLPGISFKELMTSMGIPSVELLQVTSHGNMSNTLTRRHLEGLKELTQLLLNMNALTELPEDLFQDLGNLTWLDLKNNNVVLPKTIFKHIPKLEVLELGGNNISHLEPGIFRNLTKLRLLNLWGNRLQDLTRSVFSDVPNLESLDLNNNGLVTLPPDVFADLIKLKKINLYANNFTSLPQSLFRSTTQLETIKLYSNRKPLTTLPSAFFANLKNLKELNLQSCNISSLPEDLLIGCIALENLTLQQNLLKELPEGLFQDTKEVTKLILTHNKLAWLPELIFSTLYKLKILDISHNELTTIPKDLFSSTRDLEVLKISHNKLKMIYPQAFEATYNLLILDLSKNQLTSLKKSLDSTFGENSLLQNSVKLETLYLAHNQLNTLYDDWKITMINLQVLDLSHNNFTNITIQDLQFVSTKLTIDLSFNNISLISLNNAEKLALAKFQGLKTAIPENNSVKVLLKANPLNCDCNVYDLIRYFRYEIAPEVRLIASFDGTNLTCKDGPLEVRGALVSSVDPRLVKCDVWDTDCPEKCWCSYRPSDSALVVDCSRLGLRSFPPALPGSPATLANTNHTELHLSFNRLTSLPGRLGPGYERVTKLYLAHNNLTQVNLTCFNKKLRVLELNNNNLTRLDLSTLKLLEESKSLESLTLQKNPWICDCQAKEFLTFLQRNFKKIPFIKNVTCSNGHPISDLTSSDLCPFTEITIAIASVIVAVLGLLIGGSAALYYRYQKEIKVWLYAHRLCLWFVTEEELDKDKKYDAFVSYSHQDEEFITKHLQPMLEEDGTPKYKLCLHYRDWVVGGFIPDQIARSVEDSRRTIVVLSPNFLESIWGRMEFRTAHSQALSEGRARVIVILYGDIGPTEKLDPELKAYLSMNTYVKWGDPWFWQKLRYALPHPPELQKGIPLISRHSNRLINGNETNETTTPPADTLIIDPLKTLSNTKPV